MSSKQKPKRNKIKSKRGAQKRFKFTGTGKVRFRRGNRAHINTKRSTKQMRKARANGVLADQDVAAVAQMMPYDAK
jgi:large subunit ribosomal protein L35